MGPLFYNGEQSGKKQSLSEKAPIMAGVGFIFQLTRDKGLQAVTPSVTYSRVSGTFSGSAKQAPSSQGDLNQFLNA